MSEQNGQNERSTSTTRHQIDQENAEAARDALAFHQRLDGIRLGLIAIDADEHDGERWDGQN